MKKETIIYLWPEGPGNWLTDGKDYYEAVKLGEGRSSGEFWEITDEERLAMFPEEEKEGAIGEHAGEVE